MKRFQALLLACGLAVSWSGGPAAQEVVIDVPTGWFLETRNSPFSLSPTGGAFAVYKYLPSPVPGESIYEQSRVVQVSNGEVVAETDFVKKVGRLEFSPDGSRLLVTELLPGSFPGKRTSLVNSVGVVTWSKSDHRAFSFSLAGDVIYAISEADPIGNRPGGAELFDLAGTSVKVVDFGDDATRGVLVKSASQAAVALNNSVLLLNTATSPPSVIWRTDFADYEQPVVSLQALGLDKIVVRQRYSHFTILSTTSGEVLYRYLAFDLAEADPKRTTVEYGQYRPFEMTPEPGVLLFSGRNDGLALDLDTGELQDVSVNALGTLGSHTHRVLAHDRIVIMGSDDVTLRPLSLF